MKLRFNRKMVKKNPVREAILFRRSRIKRPKEALLIFSFSLPFPLCLCAFVPLCHLALARSHSSFLIGAFVHLVVSFFWEGPDI